MAADPKPRGRRIQPTKEAMCWVSCDPPDFEIKYFPVKGRGIITTHKKFRGDFLLNYCGELISAEEGERREEECSSGFRFFFNSKGKSLCVDATEETERLGRLVNHGRKDSNAVMKEVNGNLSLFCRRDIEIGDEILYDYGLKKLPWEQKSVKKKEYVWVNKMPGVPRGVMWPAKIISGTADAHDVAIYVKSDNAEMTVKKANICPFDVSLKDKFQRLKDHQIQWLCRHLGHTMDVHQTHYRFTLDGIERIQLGKLLMLQDKNLLSRYKDTDLADIEFEEIVASGRKQPQGEDEQPEADETEHVIDDVEMEMGEIDEPESLAMAPAKHQKKSKVMRVRWMEAETSELLKYAHEYLEKRKTPSRNVCKSFIASSKAAGGELHKRSADNILKKISAMNVKARKTDE